MLHSSPQLDGLPATSSVPENATDVISRRRSALTSRTPSTSLSSAAYMRAIAWAEVHASAGISALSTSVGFPISAVGNRCFGAAKRSADVLEKDP